MVISDTYEQGELFGFKYQLTHVGNGLKFHSHPTEEQHNCICLSGKCAVFGPTLTTTVINAGEVSDFDSKQLHSIAALQPDTIILNLCLYGKPESYADVTETHFEIDYYPELPRELREAINNKNGEQLRTGGEV